MHQMLQEMVKIYLDNPLYKNMQQVMNFDVNRVLKNTRNNFERLANIAPKDLCVDIDNTINNNRKLIENTQHWLLLWNDNIKKMNRTIYLK